MNTAAVNGPRVGVALCTHNGSDFLADQLSSILGQTRPVDEIVLSDDDSSDRTVRLAKEVVAAHRETVGHAPSLVVLENRPALGVTANFEHALAASTTDLVALSDQDDVWRPDRVERALRALERRPGVELVASDARLIDARGDDLGTRMFETLGIDDATASRLELNPFVELLRRNLLTGATMIVTRELVRRARPFPPSWVHDEWLAMVAAVGGGLAVVREPLIDYRQHGGNQIGASMLDVRGRLARLRAPRDDRNRRLLARSQDLADRLPGIVARASEQAVPPDVVTEQTGDKFEHERIRSGYPERRIARIPGVVKEWRTGRYGRYGLGAQDVLRDLVQPV